MQIRKTTLVALITILILLLNYKPALALNIGQACPTTEYCNIGDVCRAEAGKTQKMCQTGPDDCTVSECGNGYICDPLTKNCRQEYSNGVPLRNVFQSNFNTTGLPTLFGAFITSLLDQTYIISLIILLIYIVWGGYRYLISANDIQLLISARKHIVWGIIGEIFIFLSYGIFQILNSLFGNIY